MLKTNLNVLKSVRTLVVSFLLVGATISQAAIIDVGPQVSTYTGNTRGYFFVAPTSFDIVGLGVANDASSANFDVQVLRLNTPVPAFPSTTTDFDTLFTARNVAGSGLVSTSISIAAGEIIGVLGSRGSNSTNSYGANDYMTSILGSAVTLSRFGMQNDLRTTDASSTGVWTESGPSFFISRVLMDVQPSSASVPEPGTLALLGFGLLSLALKRRKAA